MPTTFEMFDVAIGAYRVGLHHVLPSWSGQTATRSSLVEHFGDWSDNDASSFWVSVSRGRDFPFLVVAQRYLASGAFSPGIALVEETARLFIGAGERILCYDLDAPAKLWEESVAGFWSWCRHGDVIVMSDELELAAWGLDGTKLWTTFVEPPWSYYVEGQEIHLDVMGKKEAFPLRSGARGIGI